MKTLKILAIVFICLLTIPILVFASQGDENYFLPADQEYNANLYRAGQHIEIHGNVNGDIYAAGNSIVITGNVNGDIIAAASSIRIEGVVDGNVRVAGSDVVINGEIRRALSVAAQNLYINDTASVGATALTAAQNLEMRGEIAGNLDGVAQDIFISGSLTHTNFETSTMTIAETAEIRGNLNYKAPFEVEIENPQVVAGDINYTKSKTKAMPSYGGSFWLSKLWRAIVLYLIGLLFIWLFKNRFSKAAKQMRKDPTKALLWGVATFVLIPIITILFMVTLIGIPIAMILLGLYIIALYLSVMFSGLALGQILAKQFKWKMSLPVLYLMGLVVFIILTSLPWIGGALNILGIWWGLGAIVLFKKQIIQELR